MWRDPALQTKFSQKKKKTKEVRDCVSRKGRAVSAIDFYWTVFVRLVIGSAICSSPPVGSCLCLCCQHCCAACNNGELCWLLLTLSLSGKKKRNATGPHYVRKWTASSSLELQHLIRSSIKTLFLFLKLLQPFFFLLIHWWSGAGFYRTLCVHCVIWGGRVDWKDVL